MTRLDITETEFRNIRPEENWIYYKKINVTVQFPYLRHKKTVSFLSKTP